MRQYVECCLYLVKRSLTTHEPTTPKLPKRFRGSFCQSRGPTLTRVLHSVRGASRASWRLGAWNRGVHPTFSHEWASWDELDSFVVSCEPRGMPLIMNNPYPLEFIDEGDLLTLRGQYYDFSRIIHMNGATAPDEQPRTLLGHSVGHGEGNSLVVETTRISWPYFDFIGTPLSGALRVIERFTLSGDQASLNYHMTIIDPATFSEPATREQTLLALGESVGPFECVPG